MSKELRDKLIALCDAQDATFASLGQDVSAVLTATIRAYVEEDARKDPDRTFGTLAPATDRECWCSDSAREYNLTDLGCPEHDPAATAAWDAALAACQRTHPHGAPADIDGQWYDNDDIIHAHQRGAREEAKRLAVKDAENPLTVNTVDELLAAFLTDDRAWHDAALRDACGRLWIVWENDNGDTFATSQPHEDDPEPMIAQPLTIIDYPVTILTTPGLGAKAEAAARQVISDHRAAMDAADNREQALDEGWRDGLDQMANDIEAHMNAVYAEGRH